MATKEYKSLEWIHKFREENHARTKRLSPKDLIERTKQATEQTADILGLKIVRPKEQIRSR
ncbi:MAG: hypothetical protein A2X56_02220 [Nitrospirae bacterium GWC2_57_13]|jgi:hypothetical protein|nr:MAG: hypothetical protein A2072_00685 [Nitrospirae bacterium GWC1_57_7]OGW28794.1 MAG: hypothetical protein A2X56_02220 [Nitrospirae bacterium GWC2_57_13]OGW43266.1 MAG: hypothetical protein A2X57_08470 [Nitrospirae bacterium GWD2_57_8]HAR44717.1 hypothetical protein [Nitrospiraceae bacterium]HAS52817.1 hypothetical protein [Nitrospiraceae bacterium]